MNTAQIQAQKAQLETEGAEIDRLLTEAVETKSYTMLADLEKRVNQLAADRAELEAAEATATRSADMAAVMAYGGEALDQPVEVASKAFQPGREVNPLAVSTKSLQTLHQAALSGNNVRVKAFNTVDGLLPPQLAPNVLGTIHENRLLDYLPTQAISAPSYEIIVHNSTTGAPTPVAEGAAKPELVLNTTAVTLTAIKLAAHLGISYETLQDWSNFQSYAQTEMLRQIQDVENAQLLSGTGTSGNMTGFTHTSGVLTHDASADTATGETALDSIEKSITALRTGSALAEANLLILNPATFSAIRRIKNTLGNFLVGDPAEIGARQLFGCPVLLTTAQAAGTGILLDNTKWGRVLVREGLTVHTGTSNDDFTKNIARFVMEERLVLAVERPSAVLVISNLPTS